MKRTPMAVMAIAWILTSSILLLAGCGGGGGAPPNTVATVTGTVSGTVILAVDETGKIVAKDDTIGKAPVDNTLPARYRFNLVVAPGHRYTFYFIVGEGTASERIVTLYDAAGTSNVFSVAAAGTVNIGFVDTAQQKGKAETEPGPPAGETGPRTIRVAGDNGVVGLRHFNLLDLSDGTKRHRAQVQIYNDSGTAPGNGALVTAMIVYDNTWQELKRDGGFYFWNGSGLYVDSAGTVVPSPMADVEAYLAAAPGTLSPGFYTVAVTDNNGNLYTSKLYFSTPAQVAKPTDLQSQANPDNSVTLTWVNPAGVTTVDYLIYVQVMCDDQNQDGVTNSDSLLYVVRGVPTSTYTIPAGFVQGVLAGKPNLRWRVEIRQRTAASVEYPDGSLSVAQFYRTYSAEATLAMPQAPAFVPADLAGTWDFIQFLSGANAGWARGAVSIDGSGNATFSSFLDSNGGTTPPAGPIVTLIDGSGAVSQTEGGTATAFHGNMSNTKDLIVGTDSPDTATRSLHVARKRTGIAFSNADVASKSFAYHDLESGGDTTWEYGAGTTDSLGQVTLTQIVGPSGSDPGVPYVNFDTLLVSSQGIVTTANDPTFYGIMSSDRKAMFTINTTGFGTYGFMVILLTGQTFTQADLAGVYDFHSLRNAPLPGWGHGTISIDTAGAGTYLSYADSAGGSTPPGFQRTVSASGAILDPSDSSFHGQMSLGKDIYVKTNTNASGYHGISLSVK